MTEAELAQQFTNSFRLHEVIDAPEHLDFELPTAAKGAFDAAMPILESQAASRVVQDVDRFLNAHGPGRDLFEHEENVGLALALFILARDIGGDVQLRNGPVAIGDVLDDMTEITVEAAARRSDFPVEFLITWHEFGPHPDWYSGAPDEVPTSLDVTKELALIRDDGLSGKPDPSDRKTRRGGLASLGLLVVSYELSDVQHDPFGVAKRALGDLRRAVMEEFVR